MYIYPVVCVNIAEELFYTTRRTSRSTPTLLCVLILQRSSSTQQGAPVGVYIPCCVWLYCRGALPHDKENQWEYTYPVVCVNTAEELFYKTRSTSRTIPTLLCVLILQRSSTTRQGAPVGVYPPYYGSILQKTSSTSQGAPLVVYLPCCVCQYCRGALQMEHQWYIYPVVCVNTAEELFYTTRSTSGSIPTLLCVLLLQKSSSTRQGAQVGVYLPRFECTCKYYRGDLPQGKEHQ